MLLIRNAKKAKERTVLRSDNPFWRFSLAVYAQPGVAAECLALQSAFNIDVNVLLFCAWLGSDKKIILGDKNFAAIETHTRRWHQTVVRPLRALRQAMKPLPEMADDAVKDLRKEVAATELRAEQIEQALLFAAMDEIVAGAAVSTVAPAVTANIAAFVQRNATEGAEIPPTRALITAATTYTTTIGAKTIEK